MNEAATKNSEREDSNAVLKFSLKGSCWVKVVSNVKTDSFHFIGCLDRSRDSCELKLCIIATEGMTEVPYM